MLQYILIFLCDQNADSPADAQREEAHEDKYASGAPGQTEESETDHEQKEKPTTHSNPGTSQSGPTDQGDARKAGVVRVVCSTPDLC